MFWTFYGNLIHVIPHLVVLIVRIYGLTNSYLYQCFCLSVTEFRHNTIPLSLLSATNAYRLSIVSALDHAASYLPKYVEVMREDVREQKILFC